MKLFHWTSYYIALMKVRLGYISIEVKQFSYKEGLTKN